VNSDKSSVQINNIFKLPEEELPSNNSHLYNTPLIAITLSNVNSVCLVDTGSEVNAISKQFFDKLKESKASYNILPCSGVYVVTACGHKSKRILSQIYVLVQIGSIALHSNFLVIPGLTHDIILGVEVLTELKAVINFEQQFIEFKNNNKIEKVSILENTST